MTPVPISWDGTICGTQRPTIVASIGRASQALECWTQEPDRANAPPPGHGMTADILLIGEIINPSNHAGIGTRTSALDNRSRFRRSSGTPILYGDNLRQPAYQAPIAISLQSA